MKKIFKHDDAYLARWLNGELSQQELTEFENSEDFVLYKRIAERTSNFEAPTWNKDDIWKNISEKGGIKGDAKKVEKGFLKIAWMRYAAAACLLLIVGYVALFRGDNLEVYETFAAEVRTVELPDGSKAFLNAGSKINFDRKSFESERELELKGEAFFEVEKGSKFTVETQNGDIRVLGTSFNVRSREKRLAVRCYTGRVGVSFNEFKDEEILSSGDKLIGENKKLVEKTASDDNLVGPEWRDGRSKFVNEKLDVVIKELERQFDIKVKTDEGIQDIEKYNGGFAHDDLNTALEIVCSSINYDFKIEGKTVILTKKK